MITTRHMSLEVELVRWLLLMIAALALMLAIASVLAADPLAAPRLLPPETARIAKSVTAEIDRPFFPEFSPGRELPPAEAAARLWMTLESQRAGCFGEALSGWEQIRLPEETAHWRNLGMAAAYLQVGDLNHAELYLTAARQTAPTNAVGAYLTGLLRMEQAASMVRLPDALRRGEDRLVAYTPQEDRVQFQAMAVNELEQAILRAGEIRLDEPLLLPNAEIEEAIVVPRVGDLLVALGAENFVGKAHQVLSGLYLQGGELNLAEFHLDRAVARGLAPLYGYRDLAEMYLAEGSSEALLRVARKDLQANHPAMLEKCGRMMATLRQAAAQMWVW